VTQGARSEVGRWPRLAAAAAACVALTLVGSSGLSAQTAAEREYQIKAAFLFNFGQFVEWLPTAFALPESPFAICVLGDDPFGATLDAIAEGQTVHGRAAVVRRFDDATQATECQILFVSTSETQRLDRVFAALAGRSILTVGEAPGFTDRSGVIRFRVVSNRLRLEINTDAARAAALTISSKLLSLADLVQSGDP
jgi:hypothetical protein